jgi:hypothetical protein
MRCKFDPSVLAGFRGFNGIPDYSGFKNVNTRGVTVTINNRTVITQKTFQSNRYSEVTRRLRADAGSAPHSVSVVIL